MNQQRKKCVSEMAYILYRLQKYVLMCVHRNIFDVIYLYKYPLGSGSLIYLFKPTNYRLRVPGKTQKLRLPARGDSAIDIGMYDHAPCHYVYINGGRR